MIDCSKKLLKPCISMLITEFVQCKNDKGGEKDLMDNFIENDLMVEVLKMLRLASWSNLDHTNLILEAVKLHGKIALEYKAAKKKFSEELYIQLEALEAIRKLLEAKF